MYGDFPAKNTVCTPYIRTNIWSGPPSMCTMHASMRTHNEALATLAHCVFVCVCVCVCVCAWVCSGAARYPHAKAHSVTQNAIGNEPHQLEHTCRVGQSHTYIRCIYGIFDREITKHTVIYGVYIQFWPTLHI